LEHRQKEWKRTSSKTVGSATPVTVGGTLKEALEQEAHVLLLLALLGDVLHEGRKTLADGLLDRLGRSLENLQQTIDDRTDLGVVGSQMARQSTQEDDHGLAHLIGDVRRQLRGSGPVEIVLEDRDDGSHVCLSLLGNDLHTSLVVCGAVDVE
jgi:hypothetical protein